MAQIFRLSGAVPQDPQVDTWFAAGDPLRELAARWFERIRDCGSDVGVLLHDGRPTACVENAALAYVDAFSAHAGLGFFHGADLPDPAGLLEGSGKRMRHVKLRWGDAIDETALRGLIAAAYRDVHARLLAARDRKEDEACTSLLW